MTNNEAAYRYSWWRRFFAYNIDALLPYVFIFSFGIVATFLDKNFDRASLTVTLLLLIFFGSVIINPIVLFLSTAIFQRTFGKHLADLKVVNKKTDEKANPVVLFIREVIVKGLVLQSSSIFLLIDGAVMINSKKRLSVHDLVLGTGVVQVAHASYKKLIGAFALLVVLIISLGFVYFSRINQPVYAIQDMYLAEEPVINSGISREDFLADLEITGQGDDIYLVQYKYDEDSAIEERVELTQVFGWWVARPFIPGQADSFDQQVKEQSDSQYENLAQYPNEAGNQTLVLKSSPEGGSYLTLDGVTLPIEGDVASPAISPSGDKVCYSKYDRGSENEPHSTYSGKVYCLDTKSQSEEEYYSFGENTFLSIGINRKYIVYSLSNGEIGVIDLQTKQKTAILTLKVIPGADPGVVIFVSEESAVIDPNDYEKLANNNERLINLDLQNLSYSETF